MKRLLDRDRVGTISVEIEERNGARHEELIKWRLSLDKRSREPNILSEWEILYDMVSSRDELPEEDLDYEFYCADIEELLWQIQYQASKYNEEIAGYIQEAVRKFEEILDDLQS